MADDGSEFYREGNMQIEPYYGPSSGARANDDFRSYSASYASSSSTGSYPPQKLKKSKSSSKSWRFDDPEFQRKRRVASYNVYSVEGKMKGSFRKSFRWIKDKYSRVVYGWW